MSFEFLRRNVEINRHRDNVILVKKAIDEKRGKSLLKVPKSKELVDTSVASLAEPHTVYVDYEVREVCVDTLDNIVVSLGIDRIDFLKIDVEGAEARAFKGMKNTLRVTKHLMIEIRPENSWLIDELVKVGFKLLDRRGVKLLLR